MALTGNFIDYVREAGSLKADKQTFRSNFWF
jgi:hypothetical protein